MSTSKKAERRLLSDSAFKLVEKTHLPGLKNLDDRELNELSTELREQRDKELGLARDRRRALRGSAGGKSAFDTDNSQNKQKAGLLAEAVQRLNKERTRRSVTRARRELVGNARRALEVKSTAPKPKRPSAGKASAAGMTPKESARTKKIGSPMEKGRASQAGKTAQAKKDQKAS